MSLKNRVVKLEVSNKDSEFLTFEECLRVRNGGDMPKNKRFPDYSSLLKIVQYEPKKPTR
jgi:hypothetical protein